MRIKYFAKFLLEEECKQRSSRKKQFISGSQQVFIGLLRLKALFINKYSYFGVWIEIFIEFLIKSLKESFLQLKSRTKRGKGVRACVISPADVLEIFLHSWNKQCKQTSRRKVCVIEGAKRQKGKLLKELLFNSFVIVLRAQFIEQIKRTSCVYFINTHANQAVKFRPVAKFWRVFASPHC